MSPKISSIKPKTLFAKRLKIILGDEKLSRFEAKYGLPNGSIGKYMNGRHQEKSEKDQVVLETWLDVFKLTSRYS